MRAFLAIEVPPLVGDRPAHLTLRFLGDLDAGLVAPLASSVRAGVRDHPAFHLVVEGVGAFPSSDRPRVVWAGITEGRDALVRLAARVERAAVASGIPPETRPFSPHVTLLRVRGAHDLRRASDLLEGSAAQRFGEADVREVILFESELRREGAVHRPLERFPLGEPGGRDPTQPPSTAEPPR